MRKPASLKLRRVLLIYHLLLNLDEVSIHELSRLSCSRKTILRDIALIREAGGMVEFRSPRFYVLCGELQAPKMGDKPIHNQQLEKLHRLFYMMEYLSEEDCDLWYHKQFPECSLRTMQRDFKVLNEIGYHITYERRELNDHDAGMDVPYRHYYCDFPDSYHPFDEFVEQYSQKAKRK